MTDVMSPADVVKIVEDGLRGELTKTFAKKRKVSDFWISSSMVGGCKRKSYFDCVDPIDQAPKSPQVLATIFKGRLLHTVCQEIMAGYDRVRSQSEVKFKDLGKRLSGSIDTVVQIGKTLWVIDYKTKGTTEYKTIIHDGPSLEEIMQVQAYMFAKGATNGVLIYIDRDELFDKGIVSVHWVAVPPGEEIVKAWLDEVEGAWKTKETPIIPEQYTERQPPCVWCEYKARCYSATEMAAKDELVTVKPVNDELEFGQIFAPLAQVPEGEVEIEPKQELEKVEEELPPPPPPKSTESKKEIKYGW